jgi:hypothetical protein
VLGCRMVKAMAPCEAVLLPARKLARIARENRNYACGRHLASGTGESLAKKQSTAGPGKPFRRAAD